MGNPVQCIHAILYNLFARDSWPDDVFHLGHYTSSSVSLYDSVKHGNTTAVVESLQAQLKIKEGRTILLVCRVEYFKVSRHIKAIFYLKLCCLKAINEIR